MQPAGRFTFDTSKAQEALKKVLIDTECPISKHKSWAIAPGFLEIRPRPVFPTSITSGRISVQSWGSSTDPVALPARFPPNLPEEESSYPTVMAICTGCGYVAIFSAVALGLLPRELK